MICYINNKWMKNITVLAFKQHYKQWYTTQHRSQSCESAQTAMGMLKELGWCSIQACSYIASYLDIGRNSAATFTKPCSSLLLQCLEQMIYSRYKSEQLTPSIKLQSSLRSSMHLPYWHAHMLITILFLWQAEKGLSFGLWGSWWSLV